MSFYRTLTVGLGASQSGLSLKAQLVDYNNINIGSQVSTGFAELGQGTYSWRGYIPEDFEGSVKFLTSSGTYTGACASINRSDQIILPYINGYVFDVAPTSGSFLGSTNLSSINNIYNGRYLAFSDPSGALDGLAGKITGYIGTSKTIIMNPAFPFAPVSGDRFIIIGNYQ